MVNNKMLDDMLENIPKNKNIIFVGIGTDKIILDILGGLTCSLLKEKYTCYGTIETPIHALNLYESMKEIEKKHKDDFIIAIDACVGDKLKEVKFKNRPISPGKGVGKTLRKVGNCSIIGITSIDGSLSHNNLRFYDVYNMSREIVDTIDMFFKVREEEKCIGEK